MENIEQKIEEINLADNTNKQVTVTEKKNNIQMFQFLAL